MKDVFLSMRVEIVGKDNKSGSELEHTVVLDEQSVVSAALQTAPNVAFTEGHPPYARIAGDMTRLDMPFVTREDIENFIRTTASAEHVEKLEALRTKNAEDYRGGKRWDEINYSLTTPEHSYRANFHLSVSGATLTIRRLPKRSDFPVRPSN